MLEGVGEHPFAIRREIEIVHCAGQVEVGIRIEPFDEADALVTQIALHLKIGVKRKRRIIPVLKSAAKLAVQSRIGEICDVVAHSRDRESAPRIGALCEIATVPPFRVRHHRLPANLVKGDILRRMARRRCDRQCREHPSRVARAPLQHLHAAHRAARHGEEGADAEMVEQHGLRAHHVANGDDRKIETPWHPSLRIGRSRVVPMQPPTTFGQMTK